MKDRLVNQQRKNIEHLKKITSIKMANEKQKMKTNISLPSIIEEKKPIKTYNRIEIIGRNKSI
jgi:hypothetical protein